MALWFIVILSAVWVYFDAQNIGIRKGLVDGFWNLGPLGWALATLLLWIVGFPAYLIKRGSLKKAAASDSLDAELATSEKSTSPSRSLTEESEMLANLEKLAELHERGALSSEEFESKKRQLLAS